jgi:DNA helicase HerA-like ATPase
MEPRRLALDPFGDFTGGYETFTSARDGLRAMLDNPRSMSVRLEPPNQARLVDWGESVFHALLSIDPKKVQWDLLFLVDEIHRYSRSQEKDALLELGLQARHFGIRLALGSQRMVYVPMGLMTEVTDLAVFQIRAPADRKRLAEWTDEDDEAENAYRLERGECFLYSPL